MFVVAADEGWMPQSAEHLAVLSALGISQGLLVVTKSDLADSGRSSMQAASAARRHQPAARSRPSPSAR